MTIRRKSIEVYFDEKPSIVVTTAGTKITGRLAYPGISKNGKLYTISQLMAGNNRDMPIWLNHADAIGIEDIGPDLLPDSYRQRLFNKEQIILGQSHLTFNPETLELTYEGIVTDPWFKQKRVLNKMSVSQGVLHLPVTQQLCDEVACYDIIQGSLYEEMSLVFHAGFSIATLSTEHIEKDQAYQFKNILQNIMENNDNKKSGEGCGCGKSGEAGSQAAGVVPNAGQCPEGQSYNPVTGQCEPVDSTGSPATNSKGGDAHQLATEGTTDDKKNDDDYDDKMKDAEKKSKEAEDTLKAANEALDKARKALEASKDVPSGKGATPEETGKKQEEETKKNSTEGSWAPNADTRSREKAQAEYNDALEKKFKAMENVQETTLAATRLIMQHSKEHATRNAIIGQKSNGSNLVRSIEAVNTSFKQWIDLHIKGDENVPNYKRVKMTDAMMNSMSSRRFKAPEGDYGYKYVGYNKFMEDLQKSEENTDVSLAGNGAQPDAYIRTLSELVLVYPDGMVVTPIEQFCETKSLEPGKKEALFYDVNVPDFAPVDEQNMDAGGSGYALEPTEVQINATGGATNPQGGLVRIGFTQLEEYPIDIIQKIMTGFAMRAEQSKNYEVLTTCYDDDTAYNPATMSRRPKGGGNKGAVDDQGNTHWVNGNSGVQLTTTDSGATGAATFAGLLAAKQTIVDTGVPAENAICYLKWGGILQLLKDTSITTYTQRSVPAVITEGVIEKLLGIQLVPSNDLAAGDATNVSRGVMFLPTVSFKFVKGRELQIDADRVPRQQSVFASASLKMAGYCQRIETTCRFSFNPKA